MLASIIITNYNYGRYIGRCLRSCLNQTLSKKDYEIIIVDDKSTDNTDKIIKPFLSCSNLKYLKNKKNIGCAASANKGFKIAKGKYVVRVDADDYINENFLNFLVYFLKEYPKNFCVSCDYFLVNKFEKKTITVSAKEYPVACGIMYIKNKLKKYKFYNSKFRHREEEELRLRIGENYKIHHLNIPLYRYQIHKKNKTFEKDYLNSYKKKIDTISLKKNKDQKLSKKELLKNIIAIIPARGGSKRFKRKNMYKVWGEPMIYWTINEAKKSVYLKNIYVTTEDKKIKEFVLKKNINVINRPTKLSKDKVFKMEAIKHAVQTTEKYSKPSLVVSLQANSPNITYLDIDKAINHLIKYNRSEVISVDEDYNQNGAIRVMRYNSVFQKSLSTDVGFIVTKIIDVHTKKDLNKLED